MADRKTKAERRRDNVLRIWLSDAENEAIERAAGGTMVSTWARLELLRIAQSERKAGESNPSDVTEP